MKTTTKFIILLFCLLLIGCIDKTVFIDTDNCIIDCKELMKDYWCTSAVPMETVNIHNELLMNHTCKCILLDCIK